MENLCRALLVISISRKYDTPVPLCGPVRATRYDLRLSSTRQGRPRSAQRLRELKIRLSKVLTLLDGHPGPGVVEDMVLHYDDCRQVLSQRGSSAWNLTI